MPTSPGLVAILAYDGLCTFEFGIAVEVFGLTRPEFDFPWYTHAIAAVDQGPMRAMGGIQVLADGGQSMNALLDTIASDLPKTAKASTQAQARIQTLRAVTEQIVKAAPKDPALAFRVADDYLRAVALVLMDWAWLRIEAGVDADTPQADTRWLSPAKALRSWVLPEFQMRSAIIAQQCADAK